MVDETYMVVASHLDEAAVKKIVQGEFVDFGRLLPRDRVLLEQDERVEMVNRGGKPYFVPVKEGTASTISSFSKWEQAFRVFSDIYTRYHPQRSFELIQYNHTIHTASMSYIWDNVYLYDIDFRLHMGRHPKRSWGIILHQAWAMRLKEKLSSGGSSGGGGSHGYNSHNSHGGKATVKEPC